MDLGFDINDFYFVIIIGGFIGLFFGLLFKIRKFGLLVNVLAGIGGGYLGMWVFGMTELALGVGTSQVVWTTIIGSVSTVLTIYLLKRRRKSIKK